jgi:Polyketide cyclase / dehydrase and lipid transport
MITVAEAHASSSAPPSAFFARWADMTTWPEWNTDTEWVRLDGPFTAGSTGVLKPKGGPKVKFVIATLVADREFTDVSLLAGARLKFRHLIEPLPDGGSTVRVTVTLAGPLGWFWNLVLGKGLKASLGPDLGRLAIAAEARSGSTVAKAGPSSTGLGSTAAKAGPGSTAAKADPGSTATAHADAATVDAGAQADAAGT